jgi:DNA-binding response OmpR family regulator
MAADAKKSGRILIVDDDPDAREILSRLLTGEGYECLTAEGGEQCLEVARSEPVDVILLDVMMPGMDGIQVCDQLRADANLRSIPVILLTARDDISTRAQGMERGVSEYLTKPVNKRELFTRVQSQLHSRELDRQLERTAANIGKE